MMRDESSDPKERAENVVWSVRPTTDNQARVTGVMSALEVSRSKAVNLMLARADGGAAVANTGPVIEELRDDMDDAVRAFGLLSRSLDKQGVLLNQIARRVNFGEVVDANALFVIRECQRALDSARYKLDRKPGELMSGLAIDELLEEGDLWQ